MPLGVLKPWRVSAFSFLGLQDTCLPGVSWAIGHWYWIPGHGPIHPKGLGLFWSRNAVVLPSVADCQPCGNLRDCSFSIASHPQLQSSFENNYLCSSKGGVIYHERISASATWESARRTGSRLVKQFGGQLNMVISLWRQCFRPPAVAAGWARSRLVFLWLLAAGVHWLHELRELDLELCGERPLQPQGACKAAQRTLLLRADGRWYRCWGQCHLRLLEFWLCCRLCTASRQSLRPFEACRPAASVDWGSRLS